MKNVFVILALVAVAGCANMRPESSSGSAGSDTGSSGASSSGSPSGARDPYSAEQISPSMTLP